MNRLFYYLDTMNEQHPEEEPHALVIYSDGSSFIRNEVGERVEEFDSVGELIVHLGKFINDNRPLELLENKVDKA